MAKRELERVADGVWLLRGGVPRTMNVYLLEDEGGGVTLFDAGIRSMTHALAEAAAPLGGINRIVLGHADADHRGAAPGLRVPVFCHPADREAAESGEPLRTYHRLDRLGIPARYVYRHLLSFWDGGAVEIDGTVDEGDDVSGFRVVHLPGHAPGLIGLFRESDRLALTSDCFYVIDPETSLKTPPGPPHEAFNDDTEQARASMRKLAALEPSAAWPGPRATPLTGDVRGPARARRRGVMARKKLKAPSSRVPVAGRRRARAARLDDAGHAARVRRHAGRLAAVAGGRVAPRRRVPVRAPGGVAGRSRGPSRSRARRSCSRGSGWPRRTSGAGSATCCASTWPSTSRS